ncbi:MAG TPA: MBL fold metallo-hydrolase [Allosphingosinicella sp.]|jgi:competence protein ComEC
MKSWVRLAAFAAVLTAPAAPVPAQVAAQVPRGRPDAGTFEVHAIDVGTGLAIFVQGQDFALLYDAGSNDDGARGDRNRVLAYLRAIRPDLRIVDHLILSHPHKDHTELLPDILDAYEVRHVWNSGAFNPICSYRAFLTRTAAEPGVQYHDALGGAGSYDASFKVQTCYGESLPAATLRVPRSAQISDRPIPLGAGAAMTILNSDASPKIFNLGEASLVVHLRLGKRSLLLPGDAEAGKRARPSAPPDPGSTEGKLLACCLKRLRSDILVVAHHGSKTSSRTDFLNAVRASQYIVSSGPQAFSGVINPDIDVILALEERGVVWRTDRNDFGCAANPAKTGPDNDGKPGGCDHVRIVIDAAGAIAAGYNPVVD